MAKPFKDTNSIVRLDALMNMSNVDSRLNLQNIEAAVRSGAPINDLPTRSIDDELASLANEIGITMPKSGGVGEIAMEVDSDEESPSPAPRNDYERPHHHVSHVEDEDRDDDIPADTSEEFANRTHEQERREQIDTVIGKGPVDGGFSFDLERREDAKYSMLAAIDTLLTNLEYDGIDTSRLPKVTGESKYTEVESLLRILQHKNDHARFCTIAEELVLFVTSSLEDLLDGRREVFGRRPDLTGWSSTVNVKLRRMRHDTGRIVNDVMQDYNIGPFWRFLLELIPSAILFSQSRHRQFGQPGLNLDDASIARSADVAKAGLRKML